MGRKRRKNHIFPNRCCLQGNPELEIVVEKHSLVVILLQQIDSNLPHPHKLVADKNNEVRREMCFQELLA